MVSGCYRLTHNSSDVPNGFRDEQLFDCHDFVPKNESRILAYDIDAFDNASETWRETRYEDMSYNDRKLIQSLMYMRFYWLYGANYSIEAIRSLSDVLTETHMFTIMNSLSIKRDSDNSFQLIITYNDNVAHLKLVRINNGWSIRVLSIVNGELNEVLKESFVM